MSRVLNLSNMNRYNGPLKSHKIPDVLIYCRGKNRLTPPQEEFLAFSTKKGEKATGLLVCHQLDFEVRDDYNGPVLGVDFIETTPHGKGLGQKLLSFAKIYSKKIGCNGYICLKADCSFDRLPHLFYRKNGFTTLDSKIDKQMDEFINQKYEPTTDDYPSLLMYYPENTTKPVQKSNIVKKLLAPFSRFWGAFD